MLGVDYVKAVQMLQEELGERSGGLMIGQNGRSSTLNAWLPAALLGLKVVDAVGDMRAHPTGDMGSIGLAGVARADDPDRCRRQPRRATATSSSSSRGATAKVSPVLRTAADMSGGFIASCRNPVRASYVAAHAALGGISQALALGEAILAAEPQGRRSDHRRDLRDDGRRDHRRRRTVTKKRVVYTNEAFDIGTLTVGAGREGAASPRDE